MPMQPSMILLMISQLSFIDSIEGVEKGMLVFGDNVPEGTTVTEC